VSSGSQRRTRLRRPHAADRSPPSLILASRSPQRRAILEQLGIAFSVQVPEVDELETGPPQEVAVENAYRKAAAVAVAAPSETLVLGVDTVVALGARIYGKPADASAARATLAELSGRRHAVLSGLCLISGARARTVLATTVVEFRMLEDALIDWYLDTGEWRERAGGYAIQGAGAALVARVEGDHLNVVGLPVASLVELAPALLGI
jgi:septum formation protein